ncbi:DMT family transporter [Aliiglaciecola lipolytica]|uniref:S-adenosylmethionine uptake transporter n=1 Tax=Aliiglaciecola lipolytica E3 TaxID=1127673 RepID=K6YRU4_9ALTE|nr:DMT family transporter [Aliiglaciecola lipolytica]GAC14035.1 S-adenosylmethionine uptake transporter [Aliiglaciecola lipolytica E3]
MPNMSVGLAMLLLVVGNVVAVFSDSVIKSLPDDVATYQFVFFRQLAAVILVLPLCLLTKKRGLLIDMKWHLIRGHVWLLGAVFMVFALKSMPIATANAIFYAAPLLMMALAFYIWNEKLSKQSVSVAIVGFIGVLIVVQPTQLTWSGISALVVAVTLAANNLLVKKIPLQHSVLHTLLLTSLLGMPVAFGLALWEQKPWDFSIFVSALLSTSFILIYSAACVVAYRAVQANKIASAEYSGLIGAVIVGLIWFGEIPSMYMLIGSVLIVLPMIWLAKFERKQQRRDMNVASESDDRAINVRQLNDK